MYNFNLITLLLLLALTPFNRLHAANWELLIETRQPIGHIAVSSHNPNTLFTHTESTLYRSTDSGQSWKEVTGMITGIINGITLNPQQPHTLYVTTYEEETIEGKIFKSTDGGESWLSNASYTDFKIGDLKIDPHNTKLMYLAVGDGFSKGDFYKSTDGGDNWVKKTTEFVTGASAIAIDPHHPEIIYVTRYGSPFSGGSGHPGFFKSLDQGDTWNQKKQNIRAGFGDKLPIVINPHQPNILYLSESGIYISESGIATSRISKSVDGGETWQIVNSEPIAAEVMAINPHNPEIVYLGTRAGLYRTANGGETWRLLSYLVEDEELYITSIAIDPHHPENLYIGTINKGMYKVATDSHCIANYNSAANQVTIPCLNIDDTTDLLEVQLTDNNISLRFEISGVKPK